MGFTCPGSADQQQIALLFQEVISIQRRQLHGADRGVCAFEAVQVSGYRELGDAHLIADRAALTFGFFGFDHPFEPLLRRWQGALTMRQQLVAQRRHAKQFQPLKALVNFIG